MKKLLLLTIMVLSISCSTDSVQNSSAIIGKWSFGQQSQCGRNSIEFKDSNLFIEYHYNSNCTSIPYYGTYVLSGSLLTINNEENVIVELTNTTLKLHRTNSNVIKTYDRINN